MGKAKLPSDAEIEAVRARSASQNAREVRAAGVRVLPEQQALELALVGFANAPGCLVVVPLAAEPQLAALSPDELETLEVYPGGTTLACEPADLHLGVEALVLRALMGPDYHLRLRTVGAAALGGVKSEAKAAAARANGAKGGRPRKSRGTGGVSA